MADTPISGLPAASAANAGDEVPVNQGGTTRKVLWSQVLTYIQGVIQITESQVTGLVSDLNTLTTAITARLIAGNNLSDLGNAGTARTNLGLGNSATRNVGTANGTVAAGDDSRFAAAVTSVSGTAPIASSGGTTPAISIAAATGSAAGSLSASDKAYLNRVRTVQALTDGATISWDVNSGATATVTLGGNRAIAAPTNIVDGESYVLHLTQDGTGSRLLTWNSVFKWAGGTAPTLSTAVGAVDTVTFLCKGSNLHGSMLKSFS